MDNQHPAEPIMVRWRCRHCGKHEELPHYGSAMPVQPPPLHHGQCSQADIARHVREHVWLLEHSLLPPESDKIMWQCFHCGMPAAFPRGTGAVPVKPEEIFGGSCRKAQIANHVRGHVWVMV